MTELHQYLEAAGFGARRAQTDLYEHLISADQRGVIAQAGTGTGKSAAIISAAAHQARATRKQSIIVTPTLTLMNQYRDGDLPVAERAFDDITFAELRGRAHYHCDLTAAGYEVSGAEYRGGCDGPDAGCSQDSWLGIDGIADPDDRTDAWADLIGEGNDRAYQCGYQAAKARAIDSDVVVTNADMLIVNDRLLAPINKQIFELEGSLFVDEAHTLEQKLRDYASRSLFFKSVRRFDFAGRAAPQLADWIAGQEKSITVAEARGFPKDALRAIAEAKMPYPKPKDGLTKQRETQEACVRIMNYLADPHDSAVLHVGQGSLKMDWINVASSSGELLTARSFGLVSATVPKTMAATLGVASAPFIDVGHPFDYGDQAWLGFSPYAGDYRSAQTPGNFDQRSKEVLDLITRSKGGALLLFSSFMDLERVSDLLREPLEAMGLRVMRQAREMEAADRQAMAEEFKADGNAVLFGSESFATGFDVPGDALRLVVLWKLPYPAVDPVSNAIRDASFARYNDLMKVRAVQAMGRLIRRETDRGIVWVADSRGRRLMDPSDPLTAHIPQFARL